MPEDLDRAVDMWTPYKELLNTVEATLARPTNGVPPNFVQLLRRHKQNFIAILKNPPKNAKSREELRKGATEGITLPDVGHQILAKDLVDEALILSDMYNLNELMALDLLCTAQAQMPYHPGLTRGLVAVLLYYDGRKSLVLALKALVMARRGFTFVSDCSEEVSDLVTEYTNELLADNIISKLLDLLNSLDLSKEVELLQQNRALGGAKHHKQVVDLFESVRTNLASIIFFWSAQSGLPQDATLRLVQELKRTTPHTDSSGGADNVTLTLIVALLYAIDLSILQRVEDTDPIIQEHPLISDKGFIPALMGELGRINGWVTPGLGAVASLGWGLSLATLKQAPQHLHPIELNDEDEAAVDIAVDANAFEFILRTLFENPQIHTQEFFHRRFHQLLTDFIVLMPVKVREMKNKGEEESRVSNMYLSQGLESPPASHQLESLLLAIAKLYGEDPMGLELCLDYWCNKNSISQYSQRTQPRQVSLFKFVRKMGEDIPSLLFVPYLKMLCSLSRSAESAHLCFSMLKQDAASSISWDHFFLSLNRYYHNLRAELPAANDTIYRPRGMAKGITPAEVQGLHAVLAVIRTVAEYDEDARVALCENPGWVPLTVLLGLVSCSVPILLKADLLLALAALARSPATAVLLWNNLEASQILTTVPSTSSYAPRGIRTELDEIESRNEEYPLTRALLSLLDTLTDFPAPRLLGSGTRTPGLDPYINFVLGCVFLKFHQRGYRHPEEKWQIAGQCLALFEKFLNQYEPYPQDFAGPGANLNPPPGYHIMVNLNTKSELLRLVLQILDDGQQFLDTYGQFPEKEALEVTVLRCLELIDSALSLEQTFRELSSRAGGSLILQGLVRLLLGNNPRTGRPDHLLTIARYMRFSNWLPSHAWRAANILVVAAAQPGTQAHLVSLFTSSSALRTEIRHGFVECLEVEGDEGEDGVRTKTKEAILKLIEDSLSQPLPNIAFYLIGFDLSKDVNKTVFQQPGVAQAPRTVLHSLLALLNLGLRARNGELASPPSPRLLEAGYRLLYKLSSSPRSASPILRFLRAGTAFLPKHLAALPFKQHREPAERKQMGWLLKTTAVELKVCASSKLTSHVEALFSAIVGESADEDDEPVNWNPRVLDPDSMTTSSVSGKRNDQRFLRLLSLIPFQPEPEETPNLEICDWSEAQAVMARCQVLEEDVRVFDVKKLHRLLTEDAATSANGKGAAQRRLVQKDIETICLTAVAQNKSRMRAAASLNLMAGWRRLAETLFAVAPPAVLTNDYRQELLIDTLYTLLYKVVSASNISPEMGSLASEVLIMLLVDLRQAQIVEGRENAGQRTDPREVSLRGFGDELRASDPGGSADFNIMLSTIQANANTLKNILCGILQWILNSKAASQKLRANLYGSLLNFLYTTCFGSEEEGEDNVNWLDASRSHLLNSAENDQRKMVLRVISGFTDGLARALCYDGTSGSDLTRMVALSCLDVLLRLEQSSNWRSFIAEQGYLQLLIDQLIISDEALVDLCTGDRVYNLRPLYMYESKLTLMTRIASTKAGALLLVEQCAVSVLSSMKVFDITPKLVVGKTEEFLPSPVERLQQVLFPAIDLLDTINTSLGTEDRSGNEAILHFLLCHGDMVSTVLRGAFSYLPIAARLTSLISRSADLGPIEEIAQRPGAHTPHLLRTLMLDMIPRFLFSEVRNITSENPELTIYILEIACSLIVYVRALSSSKDRLDCRATEPVLWPGLTEAQGGEGRGGKGPLLGSVVQLLQEAVTHFHREQSYLSELNRKHSSIPTMTSAEVLEIAETRAKATTIIKDQLAQKISELDLTSFLVENTLYVIWSHLDFFMLRALPRPKTTPDYTDKKASDRVTPQDISILKSGLVSIFNDSFCKKLVDTQESRADRAFPEALVRRIKRLLQFVPVK